jgi:acetyltransferase-like isoleucine patch superfamily enzyme
MFRIDKLLRKMILGYRADSQSYIDHYVKRGALIGCGTVVYQPMHTIIDDTRPFLIEIGENVQITKGTTILTHGYDWSVLKGTYKEVLGSAGKVKIGNNVFIGMNSTILKGVTIGDNVIIGANSLVNRNIPNNTVCAGNPCKVISTLEEYYQKRKEKQFVEAAELYCAYCDRFKKEPEEEVFYEFFYLFHPRNQTLLPSFEKSMRCVNNYDDSLQHFKETVPKYECYEDFLIDLRKYRINKGGSNV